MAGEGVGRDKLLNCALLFEEAAADPRLLAKALKSLGEVFGEGRAQFTAFGRGGEMNQSEIVGIDPAGDKLQEEFWVAGQHTRFNSVSKTREGEIVHDFTHSTIEDMAFDPAYQDLYIPYGVNWYVGTVLHDDERGQLAIGTFRGQNDRAFDEKDVAQFAWLCDRISGSAKLALQLDGLRSRSYLEGVGACRAGVALVTNDLRVADATPAFHKNLREGSLGRVGIGGKVVLSTHILGLSVNSWIARLQRESEIFSSFRTPGNWLHRNPDTGSLYRLELFPLPRGFQWVRRDGSIVMAINPVTRPLPDEETLMHAFSFTRAEARLSLLLADGRSVRQAAAASGVGYETARTQAKAVYAKGGCLGQAEWIAFLSGFYVDSEP